MFLTYPQNIPMLCQIIAITAHNIPLLQTKQYITLSPPVTTSHLISPHLLLLTMITNLISGDFCFFSPDLYLKL